MLVDVARGDGSCDAGVGAVTITSEREGDGLKASGGEGASGDGRAGGREGGAAHWREGGQARMREGARQGAALAGGRASRNEGGSEGGSKGRSDTTEAAWSGWAGLGQVRRAGLVCMRCAALRLCCAALRLLSAFLQGPKSLGRCAMCRAGGACTPLACLAKRSTHTKPHTKTRSLSARACPAAYAPLLQFSAPIYPSGLAALVRTKSESPNGWFFIKVRSPNECSIN